MFFSSILRLCLSWDVQAEVSTFCPIAQRGMFGLHCSGPWHCAVLWVDIVAWKGIATFVFEVKGLYKSW